MLAAFDWFGAVMTVVGLGGLIFFHELGHFVACRLTGTRVEAFAVGFGPKLIGWKRGHTEYKIGAIPLGGYVKMAAENPGDENTGSPDEFPNKSFLARLFIMSNGVVFNIILAFGLYVLAFGIGVPFPRAEIGAVVPGDAGWSAGLRPGDLVTHVDGGRILGFEDLKTEIAFSSKGEALTLTVDRDGRILQLDVLPEYSELNGMPEIGVEMALNRALKVVDPESALAKAGGRDGDTILEIDGVSVGSVSSIGRRVNRIVGSAGSQKEIRVRLKVRRDSGETAEFETPITAGDQPQLGIMPYTGPVVKSIAHGSVAADLFKVGDELVSINGRAVLDIEVLRDAASGREPATAVEVKRGGQATSLQPPTVSVKELVWGIAGVMDLTRNRVSTRVGFPAAAAGMQVGDTIVAVGSKPVTDWNAIKDLVRQNGANPLAVTVQRGDESVALTITPGAHAKQRLLGYATSLVHNEHRETSVLGAMATGWHRTTLAMKSVVLTIRSLVTARVSARHIGGPIALAEATYKFLALGWARYLYVLALISINLAILNILPIPVLDGGQIMILCAEKLKGGPLPDRIIGYLQMTGLLFILSLIVLAFYNDIVRLLG